MKNTPEIPSALSIAYLLQETAIRLAAYGDCYAIDRPESGYPSAMQSDADKAREAAELFIAENYEQWEAEVAPYRRNRGMVAA